MVVDPFLEQLKTLCTVYPTRSKWVVVPTHALGHTLGERLAREGTNWLNLRFVTPLDIALAMGAPHLVERGISPSEEGLGPALMMRLLLDLPLEGGYFRALAEHPTMAQTLWLTVRELRMAGINPEELKAEMFLSSEKHTELVALLTAYLTFLRRQNRADMAAVYEEALQHQDWCPIQGEDCWTELPDVNWSPLQHKLLRALPGQRIPARAVGYIGVPWPRFARSEAVERITPHPMTNPFAFLMNPSSAQIPSAQSRVALFHAGGHEAEVEEVFRRILASGVSLDQVEIACASDAHVSLVWEKAMRYEWPVTLGPGIPAALTRPGRAIIGLCDWIESDFSAGHFRRLLQSGDLRVDEERQSFTAGQASHLLARAQAGWGRATYSLALARLHKSYEVRAADQNAADDERTDALEKADLTLRVRDWLVEMIASIPEPDSNGQVPLQTVVSGAVEFLGHSTARGNALDHRAAAGLQDYLSELRALDGFSCRLLESLRFIRERVLSLRVAPERPRSGYLYACSLSQLGYAGRSHVFVVGLEEGRVFSSPTEDAVLLDDERRKVSGELKLSTDRVDEVVYAVLSRLAVSTAFITFSYSCRDTREFRSTYASWLMLQAFRLQRGSEMLTYEDMKTTLGEPNSAVPKDRDSSLSGNEWWLRSVVGTGSAGVEALGSFKSITQGRVAERMRGSSGFTEFDGYVPEAGAVLDPSSPQAAFSVTELERAAECPFRFFLKKGLGIRPVAERERDKDIWLDPLTGGSELHEIYAALLRRTRDENRRPTEQDSGWLITLAQERLSKLHEELPAATPEIRDRESRDFMADVQLFLDAECANTTSTPIALEVSFGRPLQPNDQEPLARAEPVQLNLGQGITLRIAGRIDRIDEVGSSSFEVVDYKTGGFWPDKWSGSFDGGRRLQHALYGLAAIELLKTRYKAPQFKAGVYYFSSQKGGLERVRITAPTRAAISSVLGDLRDVILKGQFVRTVDHENCRFCDYIGACGGNVNRQAELKLPDSSLESFRRLTSHA